MSNLVSNGRGLILVAVAIALLTTSGCSWFRGKSGYDLSPESRPLEIPPDLDTPASEAGLRIPEITAAAPQQRSNVSGAFILQDTPMGAYGRVGIALGRIEGVTISERSQLLTVYTVSYEGEAFLIRIAAKDDGARVVAVTTEGREISAGAGAKLLGLLRERLG